MDLCRRILVDMANQLELVKKILDYKHILLCKLSRKLSQLSSKFLLDRFVEVLFCQDICDPLDINDILSHQTLSIHQQHMPNMKFNQLLISKFLEDI